MDAENADARWSNCKLYQLLKQASKRPVSDSKKIYRAASIIHCRLSKVPSLLASMKLTSYTAIVMKICCDEIAKRPNALKNQATGEEDLSAAICKHGDDFMAPWLEQIF